MNPTMFRLKSTKDLVDIMNRYNLMIPTKDENKFILGVRDTLTIKGDTVIISEDGDETELSGELDIPMQVTGFGYFIKGVYDGFKPNVVPRDKMINLLSFDMVEKLIHDTGVVPIGNDLDSIRLDNDLRTEYGPYDVYNRVIELLKTILENPNNVYTFGLSSEELDGYDWEFLDDKLSKDNFTMIEDIEPEGYTSIQVFKHNTINKLAKLIYWGIGCVVESYIWSEDIGDGSDFVNIFMVQSDEIDE